MAWVRRIDLEVLPQPQEKIPEKAAFPRKYEQMINNRRVIFIEITPGEFKRVDNVTDDIKNLPPTKEEDKADTGRAV